MKLVLIRERFSPYGGAELRTNELVRLMLAKGHKVTVLCREWPRESLDRQEEGWPGRYAGNLSFVNVGGNPFLRYAKMESFRREASAWLRGPGADRDAALSLERVPGADFFRAGDGCHAAWLRQRAKYCSALKRVSFALNPLHRTHLALERELLAHPDLKLVVANSRMVKEDLLRHYAPDPGLIRVVPAGVDRSAALVADPEQERGRIRRELVLGDSPLILFVGSGFHRKGLAFALGGLAAMREKKAVLAIAGKGRPEGYIRLAKSLAVHPRTRFLGPRPDVPSLLSAADAFILPTMYDPASVATLEALVAGLPTITTRANGSAEAIEEGRTGFVLDRADDLPGLARALDSALDLGRREYGRSDLPSMEDHATRILSLIEEFTGPRS